MLSLKRKGSYLHAFVTPEDYLTFSLGNRKISGNVLIFNLPAGAGSNGTCKQSCPGCYALKAERIYPSARRARERNLQVLQKHGPHILYDAVRYILEKQPLKGIRIHESGDFFNQEYFETWNDIADLAYRAKGVRTWTYSKRYDRGQVTTPGLNLVDSILPDGSLNYGPLEWVRKKEQEYNIPICPATMPGLKNTPICGRNCNWCLEEPHMLFVQH